MEMNQIKDVCDKIARNENYFRQFDEDELNQRKMEIADLDVEIGEMEREKKDFMDSLKAKYKPIISRHIELRTELKYKGENVLGDLYIRYDFDNKIANFYDEDGVLVRSRRMMSDEFQLSITHVSKTGTNN